MNQERIRQQIVFICEIDKVKQIMRRTLLMDSSRRENDAEHSWHLALMALLLAEYSDEPVDVARVIKMVLIHDLVEIDAGATFLYASDRNAADTRAAEEAAAERIFGLLPFDQGTELKELWQEFEAKQTTDARFAGALDRLQPLLHNYLTRGQAWQDHGIVSEQVLRMNGVIADGSADLWDFARNLIEDAVNKGYLAAE